MSELYPFEQEVRYELKTRNQSKFVFTKNLFFYREWFQANRKWIEQDVPTCTEE